jgi:hypothetical protein
MTDPNAFAASSPDALTKVDRVFASAPGGESEWRTDRSQLRDGMIVQIRTSSGTIDGWVATARRIGNPEDEEEGRFPARFWSILHYNGDKLIPAFYGSPDLEWRPLAAPPGAPPVSAPPAESAGEVERPTGWRAKAAAWLRTAEYEAWEEERKLREAAEAKCRELEGEVERRLEEMDTVVADALNAWRMHADAEAKLTRLTLAAQAARGALDTIWQLSNRGLSRAAARAQLAQVNDTAREALASLVAVLLGSGGADKQGDAVSRSVRAAAASMDTFVKVAREKSAASTNAGRALAKEEGSASQDRGHG